MAKSLEEVMSDFNSLKSKVADLKKAQSEKRAGMRKEKVISNLSKATADRENLENNFNQLEALINNPMLSDADRVNYTAQRDALRPKLDDAKRIENEWLAKKDKYTITDADKEALTKAEAEMQDVITFFAGNPEINDYLQSETKYRYKKKIEECDKKLAENDAKYKKVEDALKAPETKAEVAALQAAYKKVKDEEVKGAFGTSTMTVDEKLAIYTEYKTAMSNLETKLSAMGVLADVELMQDDFDAISKGAELPSKAREAKKINDEKTALAQRRDKILAQMESAKVAPTVGTPVIPKDLQDKIDANAAAITANETELAQAEADLKEITDKEARLQELENKIAAPTEKAELDTAEAEYKAAMDKLKADGYISSEIIPGLADKNSPAYKLFEEYQKANKEVREAILKYEGDPTPTNQKEIIDKMNAYKAACGNFDTLDETKGFTPEAWNKYLMRVLKERAKPKKDENGKEIKGEEIDPVFYDDTAKNRYAAVGKEFDIKSKSSGARLEYNKLGDQIDGLSKMQERILNGDSTLNETEIKLKTDEYSNTFTMLASKLKVKAEEITKIMQNTALVVGKGIMNFFKKIFRRNSNVKSDLKVSYSKETDDHKKAFKAAIKKREEAKTKYEAAIDGKLTDAEKQELADLKDKADKKTELEQKVTDAKAKGTTLQTEKTDLENQVAALPKPAANEISDGADIVHTKGTTQIKNAANKYFEDMER